MEASYADAISDVIAVEAGGSSDEYEVLVVRFEFMGAEYSGFFASVFVAGNELIEVAADIQDSGGCAVGEGD